MTPFETASLIVSIAAVFAYVNHRWLRQPASIGLMSLALGSSLLLLGVDRMGWVPVRGLAVSTLDSVRLDTTLLHGMLGALLFAGALHIDLEDLRSHRIAISALAVLGTLLSTFLVGGLTFFLLSLLGIPVPFGHALLFGALISPTDPIAVIGILRKACVPKSMETQIAGESLFNDGVGVVVFATILEVVSDRGEITFLGVLSLFAREAGGGVLFGLATGYATFRLLRSIDHYQTELLLTLGLVFGGYALAERLHLSAPIAAVTAGLLIGNRGRTQGMSDVTRDHLDKFWSLVDDVLNAVLFVLVGFEVIRITITTTTVVAGFAAIPVVLVARLLSVTVPMAALKRFIRPIRGTIVVLTWGGLRGGISVALALSTQAGPSRDIVLTMTYFVVAFSVLVQGLTLGRVARRYRSVPAASGETTG